MMLAKGTPKDNNHYLWWNNSTNSKSIRNTNVVDKFDKQFSLPKLDQQNQSGLKEITPRK